MLTPDAAAILGPLRGRCRGRVSQQAVREQGRDWVLLLATEPGPQSCGAAPGLYPFSVSLGATVPLGLPPSIYSRIS